MEYWKTNSPHGRSTAGLSGKSHDDEARHAALTIHQAGALLKLGTIGSRQFLQIAAVARAGVIEIYVKKLPYLLLYWYEILVYFSKATPVK
ncbi:hypothetical protein VFPPC_15391 [Pochonia chlamydosporia 170]|uniref:Uncharacterized protein n=1 Tax=Pochonia chlamydosporia 170 TaxID=1380566 RepID=A0A179G849_METCM|nr:hypothetical protein VFPPC_15391 [Pochonia chlamydosporia 170]OAQ73977.1 hypothetical protein VFPPC_15391 [Pochonia chlamydosporia 170]